MGLAATVCNMIRTLALLVALTAAPTAFLDTVKTSADNARSQIDWVVTSGLGNVYCPGKCGAVPVAARAEVAKSAVAFAKAYIASPEFEKRYASEWARSEPQPPETVEAQLKQQAENEKSQAEQQAKSLKDLKALVAAEKDPKMKKAYQEGIEANEQMMKMMNAPEQKKLMEQMRALDLEAKKTQYLEAKAKYETDHAQWLTRKDPKTLIRKHLDAFLELSATVDFKAKLISKEGRSYFADKTLEAKSSTWKAIYRLGPDATEVLRTAAKQWKSEI